MWSLEVASATQRRDSPFTKENDDRVLVNLDRGLFVVADGFGPTYGGYHAPVAMDLGLAELTQSLDRTRHAHECTEACDRAAFDAASRRMHTLDVAYWAAFQREVDLRPQADRMEVSLRVARRLARDEFDISLDSLAHFYANVTSLRFTPKSIVVGQAGLCRAYRLRGDVLELLIKDHESAESAALGMRGVTGNLLGTADTAPAEFRMDSVCDSDVYVLCTDGVWTAVSADEIASARSELSAVAMATRLMSLAGRKQRVDDTSVLIVRVVGAAP
jgi:serine/threonine protein phosphatase PrpC